MAITIDSPVSDAIVSAVAKETGADLVRTVNLVS
jgi:D-3-phosphoglycerate dehydrogenase